MLRKIAEVVVPLVLSMCLITTAHAELITLEMHFSAPWSPARADGRVTIDVPIYRSGGFVISTQDLRDFHMVISGSMHSDGVYDKAIMKFWYGEYPGQINFYSPEKLDFTKELIGQPLSTGSGFFAQEYDAQGNTIQNGAFYLNGPLGVFSEFNQTPDYLYNDMRESFQLTSLRAIGYIPPAPIPEPAVNLMLLTGLSMVGWASRRRNFQQ